MALTITSVTGRKESMGSRRFEIVDITPDNAWLAAGEALTKETLGFQTIDFILVEAVAGYVFRYDRANSKLLAYYGDNDAGADSALIPVPDGTNLAALSIRALVVGTV